MMIPSKIMLSSILCYLTISLALSCGVDDSVETIRLNERQIGDSIFKSQQKAIKAEQDSLCNLYREAELDRIVDSILRRRLKNKESLINRSKKD